MPALSLECQLKIRCLLLHFFDIVAAFDNWQSAIDIYRDNFIHPIFNQDLGDPIVQGGRT
jgi:hypothetical protein